MFRLINHIVLGLLAVLILSIPALSGPISSAEEKIACLLLEKIAAGEKSDGPLWTDSVTRRDGSEVDCELRTLTFNTYVKMEPDKLRPGWKSRKQTQWSNIPCDKKYYGKLIRIGWQVSSVVPFKNGEKVRFQAKCAGT